LPITSQLNELFIFFVPSFPSSPLNLGSRRYCNLLINWQEKAFWWFQSITSYGGLSMAYVYTFWASGDKIRHWMWFWGHRVMLKSVGIVFGRLSLLREALSEGL